MKVKLVVALALACSVAGVLAADALATRLLVGQAKTQTRERMAARCEETQGCEGYEVTCRRISESWVDCVGGSIQTIDNERSECTKTFHWGIKPNGRLTVTRTRPHCFALHI